MNQKEIILVNPFHKISGGNEGAVGPPLGLMYIASLLEQDGHSVGIVDGKVNRFNVTQTIKAIQRESSKPLLIGLYIYSFNQKVCKELILNLRQVFPDAVIVAGGPIPTSIPERVLDDISLDYLVRGEGEFALRDLVRKLKGNVRQPIRDIPGVIPGDKSVPFDTKTARITNLDDLPFPAYHLLGDIKRYSSSSRGMPFAAMITSRGCQYNCDFCSKDVFENSVARRSVLNVISEIDELIKRYGIKQVDFVDDNLANSRNCFEMFLDEILMRNYKIWFNVPSGVRADILDKKLLNKMRKANFYSLAFGIETADQDLLNMHNKSLNIDLMESKIAIAKSCGFFVYGFFIIGLPGETEGSFRKTLAFIKKTRIDMANFMIAIPFPGSKMMETVKENGKLLVDIESGIDEGFYGGKCFFSYPGLNPNDVIRRYKIAYRSFFSFKKILKLLFQCRGALEYRWLIANGLSVVKNIFKTKNNSNNI